MNLTIPMSITFTLTATGEPNSPQNITLYFGGYYGGGPYYTNPDKTGLYYYDAAMTCWKLYLRDPYSGTLGYYLHAEKISTDATSPLTTDWIGLFPVFVTPPPTISAVSAVRALLPLTLTDAAGRTFTYSAAVKGWVCTDNSCLVILHPTSSFNKTGRWVLKSKNVVIGYYEITSLTNPYAIPSVLRSINNPLAISLAISYTGSIVTFTYTKTSESAIAAVCNEVTTGQLIIAGETAENYGNYATELLYGELNIHPIYDTTVQFHLLSEIYKPEEDYNRPASEINTLHVPKIGALVIDLTTNPEAPTLYVVTNHISTSRGTQSVLDTFTMGAVSSDAKLTFENDTCMLLYSETATNGISRLQVDARLVGLAATARYYSLSRNGFIISGTLSGGKITYGKQSTLLDASSEEKYFPNCYTDIDLMDGDLLDLYVYDSGHAVIARITLTAKAADTLGVLQTKNASTVISLQIDSDHYYSGGLYIMTDDALDFITMNVVPRLVYGDGSRVALDTITWITDDTVITEPELGEVVAYVNTGNEKMWEDLVTGESATIHFKYYLPDTLEYDVATASFDANGAYLLQSIRVTILPAPPTILENISGISFIPNMYNNESEIESTELCFDPSVYGLIAYYRNSKQAEVIKSATIMNTHLTVTSHEEVYPSSTHTVRALNYAGYSDTVYQMPATVAYLIENRMAGSIYYEKTNYSESVSTSLYVDFVIHDTITFYWVTWHTRNGLMLRYRRSQGYWEEEDAPADLIYPTHFTLRLPNQIGSLNTNLAQATTYIEIPAVLPNANVDAELHNPVEIPAILDEDTINALKGTLIEGDRIVLAMEYWYQDTTTAGTTYRPLSSIPVLGRVFVPTEE